MASQRGVLFSCSQSRSNLIKALMASIFTEPVSALDCNLLASFVA